MSLRYLVGIILIFLLVSNAGAFILSCNVTCDRTFVEDQTPAYVVDVFNDLNNTEVISYSSADTLLNHNRGHFTLEPNRTQTLNLTFKFRDAPPIGVSTYHTLLFRGNESGDSELKLRVAYVRKTPPPILPPLPEIVFLQVNNKQPVDPRQDFSVNLIVYNPSNAFMSSAIKFFVEKDDTVITSGEMNQSLEPLSPNNIILPLRFNSHQAPGDYSFRIRAYNMNYSIDWNTTFFSVMGWSSFSVLPSINSTLFGRVYSIAFENSGTAEGTASTFLPLTPIDRLLGISRSEGVTLSKNILNFNVTVSAGAFKILQYRVSYLPIYVMPFFLIICIMLFLYYNRKVVVGRIIQDKSFSEADNSFSFRVRIVVKNLSDKRFSNVAITERVLPFVKRIGGYGTLHPSLIQGKYKKLLWSLHEIEPHGELVISYSVTTSVAIIGRLVLPRTILRFKIGGRSYSAHSNSTIINIGESAEKKEFK